LKIRLSPSAWAGNEKGKVADCSLPLSEKTREGGAKTTKFVAKFTKNTL
jgi:hypothetical protein